MRDEELRIKDWMEKDIFAILVFHIVKSLCPAEDFFEPSIRGLIEEEWTKFQAVLIDILTLYLHQKRRAIEGDLRWMKKPDGMECIGYGKFYRCVFGCVDSELSEVGFGQNCVEPEAYAQLIKSLQAGLIIDRDDGYAFLHPELVQGQCPEYFPRLDLVRGRSVCEEEA